MPGLKILDRHLAQALIGAALLTALVLLGLSGFVSFVEDLDSAGRYGLSAAQVAQLTLLKLPELLFDMFPLIVLLGAILGLGGLAASGELVVMQAAGMPVWRIAASAATVGLLLGLLALVVGDRLVPWANAAASDLRSGETRSDAAGPSLWVRNGRLYVHVGAVVGRHQLESLRVFELDEPGSTLVAVESAARAEYRDGRWQAYEWQRVEPTAQALLRERAAQEPLRVSFEPELLELFLLRAGSLSLPGLQRYIAYLESNKLDSHRPRLAFWQKLATPLSVVAMVFIAVPFVLGPLRDTGAGQRLFVGVLMGIGFYVLNETVVNLGAIYRWSPPAAALSPAILLGLVALWRLVQYRAR